MTFTPSFTVEVSLYGDQFKKLYTFLNDGSNWVRVEKLVPEAPPNVQGEASRTEWANRNTKPAAEGMIAQILSDAVNRDLHVLKVGIRTCVPSVVGHSYETREVPRERLLSLYKVLRMV